MAVAALGGAAVGVERQRSGHASGPHARFGGIRVHDARWTRRAGRVARDAAAPGVCNRPRGRRGCAHHRRLCCRRPPATLTPRARLLPSSSSRPALPPDLDRLRWRAASSRSRRCSWRKSPACTNFAGRIDDEEMRAAARFGVMAVVILPLLPEGPVGPWGGIRPRELWMLVLFFSGISFAGYIAQRMFGAGRGYPVAGLLGGVVSSTNTTFSFARLEPARAGAFRAAGRRHRCRLHGALSPGLHRGCGPQLECRSRSGALPRSAVPLGTPRVPDMVAARRRRRSRCRAAGQSPADRTGAPDGCRVPGRALRGRRDASVVRRERTHGFRSGAGLERCRCAHDFHVAHRRRWRLGGSSRQGHCRRHSLQLRPQDRAAAALGPRPFTRLAGGVLVGMAVAVAVAIGLVP